MDDDDISAAMHEFTSSGDPATRSELVAAIRHRRKRRRVALGSAAMVAGVLAGVLLVNGAPNEHESPVVRGRGGAPEATDAPRVSSADIDCDRGEELAFAVNSWHTRQSTEEITGESPELAITPWLHDGQEIGAVSENGSSAKAKVVAKSGVTVSVISLSKAKGADWAITQTTVCADRVSKGERSHDCGARVKLVDGPAYVALRPQTVLGPGGWVGQAVVPPCAVWASPVGTIARPRAGALVHPRGRVGPVTLFRESEVPPKDHVVAVIDDMPVLLESVER